MSADTVTVTASVRVDEETVDATGAFEVNRSTTPVE